MVHFSCCFSIVTLILLGHQAGQTLSLSSLLKPTKPGVEIQNPSYDRSKVTPGIIHVGLGNFHRGHMALYIDDYLGTDNADMSWGIVGAGVGGRGGGNRKLLQKQDWLQTIVERDGVSDKARVIGSMIDFLPVDYDEDKHQALKDLLVDPQIKIVSLTVTEGGYFLSDSKFDAENPLIKADIENADDPRTIFAILVNALAERKKAGTPPFSVLSCDNVPHNGDVVRSVMVGLAKLMRPDVADYIQDNVGCPNNMVDRIVPGTTDEQRAYVKDKYGYDDAYPIFCEPFRQWVLEDTFSYGRPKIDSLEGVKFVPDVTPYEFMKIRILNGGHASLCYPSALLGVEYVHGSMEHPTIGPFLDALERNEIIPTVPPVPDTDLVEYWGIIAERFSNPTIMDTIDRNCYDGASRQPKFIVPVVADNLKAGRNVDGLALVSAMWCRYCQGVTESGEAIAPNDPQWDRLQANAKDANNDPTSWLGMTDVYGDVGKDSAFIESFAAALKTIQDVGVEEAMKKYTAAAST